MLNNASTINGYKLHCIDGVIGEVKDLYFDDRHWTIRYLVVDTGNWLTGRKVLISPYALGDLNKEEKQIAVSLTKKQIEESPSLTSDKPVSKQFEASYYLYYGWPMYWDGPHPWGFSPDIMREQEKKRKSTHGEKAWDPYLRSTQDVKGHTIQASDGEIGTVDDFIVDDHTWAIRYLIVDTGIWLPGKKVLVSPQWIERVSWEELTVFVNLSRETIKQSPEYTETAPLSRDYETGLYRHYDRQGYWGEKP
jgi:sporulation protein YlmC with PRC-barrel domain